MFVPLPSPKIRKKQWGVTLVELLLVIAIVTSLSAATVPIASSFLVRNYLHDSSDELMSLLYSARINSISNKNNSSWGVSVVTPQMTLFKGSSFAGRDTAFDQSFDIPGSISVTNDEITFDQHTGNADAATSFSVTSNTGDSKTININEVGNINAN